RGQGMRTGGRQTEPFARPVVGLPVEPGSFEPGTEVVTIDHCPSLRNPSCMDPQETCPKHERHHHFICRRLGLSMVRRNGHRTLTIRPKCTRLLKNSSTLIRTTM